MSVSASALAPACAGEPIAATAISGATTASPSAADHAAALTGRPERAQVARETSGSSESDLLTVPTGVASAVAAGADQQLQLRGNAAGNAGQQPLVTGAMPARLSATGTRE